jgi:hypothetical protein
MQIETSDSSEALRHIPEDRDRNEIVPLQQCILIQQYASRREHNVLSASVK